MTVQTVVLDVLQLFGPIVLAPQREAFCRVVVIFILAIVLVVAARVPLPELPAWPVPRPAQRKGFGQVWWGFMLPAGVHAERRRQSRPVPRTQRRPGIACGPGR